MAMADMGRAGRWYEEECCGVVIFDEDEVVLGDSEMIREGERECEGELLGTGRDDGGVKKGMNIGNAVLGPEEQITPADTPMEGNFDVMRDISYGTKKAFTATKRDSEPFPVYLEPMEAQN